MVFSFILALKSEFFEGIDNEKVNEVFSGTKKALDYSMNICLNKNLQHEGLLNKVENNMKELQVNDKKISDFILRKSVELEIENKALQENNKEIIKYLEILENSLRQAQNKTEFLKKDYESLKSENNNLLADLKTTKRIKTKIKMLSRNAGEKQNNNINDVQRTNCYSTKGTFIFFFIITTRFTTLYYFTYILYT